MSGKILTVLLRGDISPFTKLNTVISKKYEIRMSQNSNLLLFLTCFISYVKYSWFPQLYRVGCWHTPSANERRLSLNVTKKSQCVFFHPTLEDICLNSFWSDLGIEAQKMVGKKRMFLTLYRHFHKALLWPFCGTNCFFLVTSNDVLWEVLHENWFYYCS